jgi:hypothetical protein
MSEQSDRRKFRLVAELRDCVKKVYVEAWDFERGYLLSYGSQVSALIWGTTKMVKHIENDLDDLAKAVTDATLALWKLKQEEGE